VKNVSGMRY